MSNNWRPPSPLSELIFRKRAYFPVLAHFRPFSSNIDNLKKRKAKIQKLQKNIYIYSKIPKKNLKNPKNVRKKN